MDPLLAAELAHELDRTRDALASGERLLAGVDRAVAALALEEQPRYTPLRTLFAQALQDTQRVQEALRVEASAKGTEPASTDPGGVHG